jgi:hypothetical protein
MVELYKTSSKQTRMTIGIVARALLVGILKATGLAVALYVGFILVWFTLMAACVQGQGAGACGGDIMTSIARALLSPFF